MTHKQYNMSKKFDELRAKHKEKGNVVSPLLPAQWIELKGKFTSKELLEIAKDIDRNFQKVNKINGNKK
jgi:hypothetical protein